MSEFTTPLVVSPLRDGRTWIIKEQFTYHVGEHPSEETLTVPVGFHTDFASVPKIFWALIYPYGKQGKAAVIHDYCYAIGYESRKRSDDIFREALEVLEVKPWKRFLMYWAVRIFAGVAWKMHQERRWDNSQLKIPVYDSSLQVMRCEICGATWEPHQRDWSRFHHDGCFFQNPVE